MSQSRIQNERRSKMKDDIKREFLVYRTLDKISRKELLHYKISLMGMIERMSKNEK